MCTQVVVVVTGGGELIFLGVGLAGLINNKLSRRCMQCLCKFITVVIGRGSAVTVWPIFCITTIHINSLCIVVAHT